MIIVDVDDPPGDSETGLLLNETVGPLTAETVADNWTLPLNPRLSTFTVD